MEKDTLFELPVFTETKLKEILHYTDIEANPIYESFKSNSIYEIHSGAKGVSKSFSRMVITIYNVVNDINFNSVWCRNIYAHISTTLVPMLKKVLDFLDTKHNLNFKPFFYITNAVAYWTYDDGGKDRGIFFANWQNMQSFQGITLQKNNFYFGEIVIDEPIEDPNASRLSYVELEKLYESQALQLPVILNSTVFRTNVVDGVRPRVTFLYNIFTTKHFVITNFHNQAIKLLNDDGAIREDNLNELLESSFLQTDLTNFDNGAGLIVSMYSKFFVPKKEISEAQKNFLDNLKENNYKIWVITVAGYAFQEDNNKAYYFLKDYIYKENSNKLSDKIKIINEKTFWKRFENKEYIAVYDGFDPGLRDNSAWVRIALKKDGGITVMRTVFDLKQIIGQKEITRKLIHESLYWFMLSPNRKLEEYINKWKYLGEHDYLNLTTMLFTDNDLVVEALNSLFQERKLNTRAYKAVRRDTKRDKFGILNRQEWQKWIFNNGLIDFVEETEILIECLAKQVITDENTKKRNETITPHIYDLINAFEMACSVAYKWQYRVQIENTN